MIDGWENDIEIYLFVDFDGPRTKSDAFAETLGSPGHGTISRNSDIVAMDVVEKQWR